MTRRTERVAEVVREEVARLLRSEVQDPRLRLVTLTRVDVAPDLSHALCFWSVLEDDEERLAQVQAGLDRAASFLRARVASELPLRSSGERRRRLNRLTRRLRAKRS